jgi:hypothetical protein
VKNVLINLQFAGISLMDIIIERIAIILHSFASSLLIFYSLDHWIEYISCSLPYAKPIILLVPFLVQLHISLGGQMFSACTTGKRF